MLIDTVKNAFKAAVKNVYDVDLDVNVSRPEPVFGDFASNVALQLSKSLSQNPREIADQIAEELKKDTALESVAVAGPGFINVFVQDHLLLDETIHQPDTYAGQSIVIETNNPNPFKDLHIGHAYNCIIADTIANLIDVAGADVHRVSYHGDVGLHVGRSMWAILRDIDGKANTYLVSQLEKNGSKYMSAMYIEGAKAHKEDEVAKALIEQYARDSFDPQGQFKEIYELCRDWSYGYISSTVKRLGSAPTERRYVESEADELGSKTVRAHIGDVFEESDRAIVFKGEKYGLHTRVFIAARGTSLYEARDLGLMQLKYNDYQPQKSIIVTGQEQEQYFNVVIKAAELVLPQLDGVTKNIPTGTVKLSTGKMSSRTGEVLNIEWLFDNLQQALSGRGGDPEDYDTLIGALRYAMLRVRIGSDVVFDVEQSLSVEGNSGPYLQYAHARARSIIRKSSVPAENTATYDKNERLLAAKISEYPEVLTVSAKELLPHLICNYLYELSQVFNRFYEKSPVVGNEREGTRVYLVESYANILKNGLAVLGIPAPERM